MRRLLISFISLLSLQAMATPPGPSSYQQERLARTALELAQSLSGDWDPSQRDCAGFVRYVYRKSLHLPSTIWKNLEGEWVDYVGAAELVSSNFSFLTRGPSEGDLQTGDILTFFNPQKPPTDAWHLMMILKAPGRTSQQALVVYHNGDRGPKAAIRKVRWSNLMNETSAWQPIPGNSIFQGVYRWQGWSRLTSSPLEIKNTNDKDTP